MAYRGGKLCGFLWKEKEKKKKETCVRSFKSGYQSGIPSDSAKFHRSARQNRPPSGGQGISTVAKVNKI